MNNQNGFVISIITFFILTLMLSTGLSMSAVTLYRQKIATNAVKSTQSYYAAEAGAEDALWRLNNNSQMAPLSYALTMNGATASVVVSAIVGGSRTITSQGDNSGIIRKLQLVYSIDAQGVSFHYGVQVGIGGLQTANESEVQGNVFSNGSVTGTGTIVNNVIVAGTNNINGVHIMGDALVHSCLNATVDGNLTYVTGGTVVNCTVGGATLTQSGAVDPAPLPILQSQIDAWKAEAEAGGVIADNIVITDDAPVSMGPVKIAGNLVLLNNATLNLTGTLYVTGSILANNGATIKLDNSYGSVGGALLSDGVITLSNNTLVTGSGQPGSYLLILSSDSSSLAIVAENNVNGAAILYTTLGTVQVHNNVNVREVTGNAVALSNNAIIQYESGLENAFFANGPGGGWKVTSWG